MTFSPHALTVTMLAERWGTSDTFVYDEIKRGRLRAFRLGAKLIRIRLDAVEEYEAAGIVQAEAPAPLPDQSPRSDAAVARLIRAQVRSAT